MTEAAAGEARLHPYGWFQSAPVDAISGHDVVLFGGGVLLITKSVLEIHQKMEAKPGGAATERAPSSFASTIAQSRGARFRLLA